MSPEAQNPGTQAGSDKFVEGHHPTDGVRAFKHGDLADVAPMLQVPDSPGVIDQTTLETEVTKIPLERKSSKKRLASIVAGVVGAAVLGGGGYAGYRATQGDEPQRETTSVSPERINPDPETDSSPAELVGTIVNNDLDLLNARPTAEILAEAKEPIPSSLPIEDAAIAVGKKLKVFYLSGDIDIARSTDDGHITVTPESEMLGNELLGTIFSNEVDVTSPTLDWMRGARANTSRRLNYYGTDEQYNIELGRPEYATSDYVWTVVSSNQLSPTSGVVSIESQLFTNFEALDRDDMFDHPEIDTNQTFHLDVAMTVEQGAWRVASLTPTN